ncbi:MAG: hypothetical protein NTW04_04910 [Elusimicrobia bacterium]|nr:hypothetical protein [Elusimicrobiota bacterium]
MKKIIFISAVCIAALYGCRASNEARVQDERKISPDATIATAAAQAKPAESRMFALGKSADQDKLVQFQNYVDRCYQQAAADGKAKFAYTLSPSGAVNPFSKIEIVCLSALGSDSSKCGEFLNLISRIYK